jgi:DNA-binding transcriptional LysR family regulator
LEIVVSGSTIYRAMRDGIAAGRLVCVLEDRARSLAPLCLRYPDRRHSSAAVQAFIASAREFAVAEANRA